MQFCVVTQREKQPMTTLVQQHQSSSGVWIPEGSTAGGSLLLIEDNPIDALRTRALLRARAPEMSCRHVGSLAEATVELLASSDCVLLDLNLPDAQDQEGLKKILHRAMGVPVIVLTGLDDPKSGLESLRNGAQDYLTKDTLDAAVLERSIRFAIERKVFEGPWSGMTLSERGRISWMIGDLMNERPDEVAELKVRAAGFDRWSAGDRAADERVWCTVCNVSVDGSWRWCPDCGG
jgi:DNA-binding NarL/FixJ family response regulator